MVESISYNDRYDQPQAKVSVPTNDDLFSKTMRELERFTPHDRFAFFESLRRELRLRHEEDIEQANERVSILKKDFERLQSEINY